MTARLALVTGGHRRLGAAISARLAAAGYAVAIHGSRDAEPEPQLAKALEAAEWAGFVADFSEGPEAAALVGRVAAHFGRAPDLLVNNAAMFGDDDIATVTEAALSDHFAVNAAAPVLLARTFAASGGEGRSIVNILDQRIAHPHGDQLSYTVSKLALAGFTRIAARALAPAIRVNAVAPGLTIATDDYAPEQVSRLAGRMPLQRLPEPEAIADAVVYLADARNVTGQTIFVDAGAHLCAWERDFMHLER